MSYQKIVDTIRNSSVANNPTGRFINGRIVDASRIFDGAYPLIVLYPFTIRKGFGEANDAFDSTQILLGFWRQDQPDSTEELREQYIAEMDVLSDLILNDLFQVTDIRITSVDKEPQYQFYQGTLSGFAVRFNLSVLQEC